MNCEEAREAFTDLYDGALSGPPLAALSQHLDGCPACRREWVAFRRTMGALRDLGDEEPSRDFAARIAERIETPRWWQRAARALVYPLPVKLPIHAAALVVLGMAGLWVSQRSPELQRAADTLTPIPMERAAPAPSPAPPVSPSTSAKKPKAAPRAPSPPAEAITPTPPAPARRDEGMTPPPPARGQAVESAPPPPAATARQAESESAALRPLRTARPPLESRGRAESTLPDDSGVPAGEKTRSAPAARAADEIFSAAATEFAAQRYEKAIEAFGVFLARHPTDARAPDARFLLADAYRALGRHAEASAGFAAFLRQYPEHRRAPVALYRQAESRLAAADPSGCAMLRDALSRYPEVREAATARETLAARCP